MDSKMQLDLVLMKMLGSQDLVDHWWVSPNKYFDLQRPIDVWHLDSDNVKNYILSHLDLAR